MSRRIECFTVALSLAFAAPACLAAQFTFANGQIQVTVPDGWSRIMQTHGDPETMVFQVPDPAEPNVLARITVTSEREPDIASFQRFVAEHTHHAQALPHFKADKPRSTATTHHYTANEGSVKQTYVERYAFHDGYAIMVRCVRPSHSQAGAAWTAAFDQGCASIAASVK